MAPPFGDLGLGLLVENTNSSTCFGVVAVAVAAAAVVVVAAKVEGRSLVFGIGVVFRNFFVRRTSGARSRQT